MLATEWWWDIYNPEEYTFKVSFMCLSGAVVIVTWNTYTETINCESLHVLTPSVNPQNQAELQIGIGLFKIKNPVRVSNIAANMMKTVKHQV